MPNLSIKAVPEPLTEALRQRAARNHRSLQGELMAILEATTTGESTGTTRASLAANASPATTDLPPEAKAVAPQPPATREARLTRLREIIAQAAPYRATDRLSRDEAHDRDLTRKLGI